jgi:hypothetical protein
MNSNELSELTRKTPFEPFHVTLSSGEQFTVARSHRAAVAGDVAVFGIEEDPNTGVAKRMRMVPVSKIVAVDLLNAQGK